MISLKQEIQNYPRIDLDNIIANTEGVSDNIRNSIDLYNKALDSLRTGSEDIAIIELKKAISLNPNFYEAMNLLGLCYSHVKEDTKAVEIFNKVISAENNSIMALNYLKQLNGSEGSEEGKSKKKKRSEIKPVKPIKTETGDKKNAAFSPRMNTSIKSSNQNGYFKNILVFLLGAAIMLLLTFFILDEPFAGSTKTSDNPSDKTSYQSKYNDLSKKYKNIQKTLKAANANVDYYKNVINLYQVEKAYNEKKYEEAADLLILLKSIDFKGKEKQKYSELYNSVMPNASLNAYNSGNQLMYMGKYREAVDKYSRCQLYYNKFSKMDSLLYNLGKCYTSLKEYKNAATAYKKLIKAYPQSVFAGYASYKLKSLE